MLAPNGLGSLWRSSRWHAATSSSDRIAALLLREREDIEHASRSSLARQILHCISEPERRRRVARVELTIDDPSGPTTDARDHRNILPAVGPAITDRLPDDPAAGLELPQQFTGSSIERFEPAVERPVENEPAGCGERRAP